MPPPKNMATRSTDEPQVHITWHDIPPTPAQITAWRQL